MSLQKRVAVADLWLRKNVVSRELLQIQRRRLLGESAGGAWLLPLSFATGYVADLLRAQPSDEVAEFETRLKGIERALREQRASDESGAAMATSLSTRVVDMAQSIVTGLIARSFYDMASSDENAEPKSEDTSADASDDVSEFRRERHPADDARR